MNFLLPYNPSYYVTWYAISRSVCVRNWLFATKKWDLNLSKISNISDISKQFKMKAALSKRYLYPFTLYEMLLTVLSWNYLNFDLKAMKNYVLDSLINSTRFYNFRDKNYFLCGFFIVRQRNRSIFYFKTLVPKIKS